MAKGKITFVLSVISVAMLLFAASCSGPDHHKEIATLDSLKKQLDSAEVMLMSIDSARVIEAVNEIPANMQLITTHYRKLPHDSIMDRGTATKIMNYRSVLKPFRAYKDQHKQLAEDIDYSRKQLTNLMHDLEKNLIEEKDVPEYVNREKSEAAKTIQITKMLSGSIKEVLVRYNETEPAVKELVKSMNADSTKTK